MTDARLKTVRSPALLALLLLAACPGTVPPPGDEQMGLYGFSATRAELVPDPDAGTHPCNLVEVPDGGFTFEAAFSRFRDAGRYFVSIGGVPHDAEFDGQRIRAAYGAQRNFSMCGCDGIRPVITMTETLSATIVSRSQSDAVEGCTENPPFDPDAGIVRPETTSEGGFDAVRACGSLTEVITLDPPCNLECHLCALRYTITGDRR